MRYSIETFQLEQQSSLSVAAAALLVHEIYSTNLFPTPESFIACNGDPAATAYAIREDQCGVVGAALVFHGMPEGGTHLTNIAVDTKHQRLGYGRFLLQRIGERAIKFGDATVAVAPTDRQFYEHMGFDAAPDVQGLIYADAAELMRHPTAIKIHP